MICLKCVNNVIFFAHFCTMLITDTIFLSSKIMSQHISSFKSKINNISYWLVLYLTTPTFCLHSRRRPRMQTATLFMSEIDSPVRRRGSYIPRPPAFQAPNPPSTTSEQWSPALSSTSTFCSAFNQLQPRT